MNAIVIKKDGSRQKFERQKIERGLERAGVSESDARKISAKVEKKIAGKKELPSLSIREMVASELHAMDKNLTGEYLNFKKAIRDLTKQEKFLENRLVEIAGENGKVTCVYGGFHILVNKPDAFDYAGIFNELLSARQTIRIELSEGKFRIITK